MQRKSINWKNNQFAYTIPTENKTTKQNINTNRSKIIIISRNFTELTSKTQTNRESDPQKTKSDKLPQPKSEKSVISRTKKPTQLKNHYHTLNSIKIRKTPIK